MSGVGVQILPADPAQQQADAVKTQQDVQSLQSTAGGSLAKVVVFVVVTIVLVAIAGAEGRPDVGGAPSLIIGVLMLILAGLVLNRYGAIGGWLTGASKVLGQ